MFHAPSQPNLMMVQSQGVVITKRIIKIKTLLRKQENDESHKNIWYAPVPGALSDKLTPDIDFTDEVVV